MTPHIVLTIKKKEGHMENKFPVIFTDEFLINWIKSEYQKIKFIKTKVHYEAHGLTDNLIRAINSLDEKEPLYKQRGEVAEIWRYLLGKAIVYLKFTDTREEHHDDEDYGVEKLTKFFKTFREFEPLLYGSEEAQYREHIGHTVSVFLAGEYIISNSFGFSEIEIYSEGLKRKDMKTIIEPDVKEAMWCVMALLHDLGIALEKIPEINPKARNMLSEFGIGNIQELSYPVGFSRLEDFGLRLISSDVSRFNTGKDEKYIHHVQSKYFMKFSEAYERRNHGIIGALVVLKNLVFFLETDYSEDRHKPLNRDDVKHFILRREILRSIASHSNENIYYLRIQQFPFLLMIFDEIHEWARPRFISILEKDGLETEVTVNSFSIAGLDYAVTFKQRGKNPLMAERQKQLEVQVFNYFTRKCDKFRRILRSAVGESRNISLKLQVINQLTEAKFKVYELRYTDPENIEIKIDGKVYTLEKLNAEKKDLEKS